MKKSIVAMFTLSMVFLFAFSMKANAVVGSQEVEKTFAYECTLTPPGIEPTFIPSPVTIKTTVPDKVAKDEEFYLTNTLISVILPFPNPGDQPFEALLGDPNFKITYGNENLAVHTFVSDVDVVIPPGANLDHSTVIADGVDVGPFTANENGEVILKTDEIRANFEIQPGNVPIILGFLCPVPEDEDLTIATVSIDGEAPVITLNGDNPMIVKQGDAYEEPGATAQDNFDGDVSDDIEITGDVDTDAIGTYTMTYTVSDSVGNEATVERTVNVVEPFGSWYTGEGPPSDSLGTNGDSYLDITTGDVYKRDPNTWIKTDNLKGDDGIQGSAILTGSGSPSADAGDVGDLYLDTNTGDVYEKAVDGWKTIANLQGPAGPQGPKGEPGSGGGSGSGGDGDGKGTTKTSTGSDTDSKGKSAQGGKLPKTATSVPTLILIGTLLATIGGVLFLRRRKAIE